jgi:hypothetical protein
MSVGIRGAEPSGESLSQTHDGIGNPHPSPGKVRQVTGYCQMARLLALGVACALGAAGPNPAAANDEPQFSLSAIAIGAVSRTDLALGMIEARLAVSPHLQLSATPTLVAIEGGNTEHQLRTAITFLTLVGSVRIDDRNMWVFSDAGTTRYRNRLRLTIPVEVDERVVRFQLVDEAFYEMDGRGWFRNMLGAGVGLDMRRAVSIDAYWMLQDDDRKDPASLFYVTLTAHLR